MKSNVAGFNYDVLDAKARKAVKQHTKMIHGLIEQSTRSAVEIGRSLIAVKEALGTTVSFRTWLEAEFRWSQSTASNLMRVAQKFGDLPSLNRFQHSALYELVRERVDPQAVDEAIAAADSGETVTRKRAREIVNRYATRSNPAPKPTALYALRTSIKSLTENIDTLLASAERSEIEELADQLLQLAMQLRTASKGIAPEAKPPAPAAATAPRKRKPATAAA